MELSTVTPQTSPPVGEELDLTQKQLADNDLLAFFEEHPNLHRLILRENTGLSTAAYAQLPESLVYLDVAVCQISGEQLLTIVKRCRRLQTLILRDNWLLPLRGLAEAQLPDLRMLDVSPCINAPQAVPHLRGAFPNATVVYEPDIV